MIEAGTIRAYLTLSSHDFTTNLNSALEQLRAMSDQCAMSGAAAAALGLSMDGLTGGGLARMAAAMRSGIADSRNLTASMTADYNTAAAKVAGKTSELASRISGSLSSVQLQARQAMVRAGEGMVAGLGSMQAAVVAKAQAVASKAAAAMRSALRIASPSRVTREIGVQTAMGMAVGMSDMQQETERRAKALAGAAVSSLSSVSADGVSLDLRAERTVGTAADTAGMAQLCTKLDILIDRVTNSQQKMEIDGRSFARLLKEYV